jgi:hypothetical protein
MAGPDDYVLHCPANVERIRIATVVSRSEADGRTGKRLRIVAHPSSPIEFETSERVEIDLTGSAGDDVMIGPKHGGAKFFGGAGDDLMIARAKQANRRHAFHGEAGNDTLHGGPGRDTLDGGTGDDLIHGNAGRNRILGGHGNDVIHDGEGASTIDPGPGRNEVTLGPGDHEVATGPGFTRIAAVEGAKTFRIGWGGVTVLTGWSPQQTYDLSDWPAPPRRLRPAPGTVRLRAGLTILDIHGVPDDHDIAPQIRRDPS